MANKLARNYPAILRPAGQACPDPPAQWVDESERQAWITANPTCPAPGPVTAPTPPQLVEPANDALVSEGPVTFSWTQTNYATAWSLRICRLGETMCLTDESFQHGRSRTVTLPPGTYAWSVAAQRFDEIGGASRSNTRRLVVAEVVELPATLKGPVPGAEVTRRPTLGWSAVSGAASYRVKLCRNGTDCFVINTPGTAVVADLPSAGTYTWTVEAVHADGTLGPASASRTFTASDAAVDTVPTDVIVETIGSAAPRAMSGLGKVVIAGVVVGGAYAAWKWFTNPKRR